MRHYLHAYKLIHLHPTSSKNAPAARLLNILLQTPAMSLPVTILSLARLYVTISYYTILIVYCVSFPRATCFCNPLSPLTSTTSIIYACCNLLNLDYPLLQLHVSTCLHAGTPLLSQVKDHSASVRGLNQQHNDTCCSFKTSPHITPMLYFAYPPLYLLLTSSVTKASSAFVKLQAISPSFCCSTYNARSSINISDYPPSS